MKFSTDSTYALPVLGYMVRFMDFMNVSRISVCFLMGYLASIAGFGNDLKEESKIFEAMPDGPKEKTGKIKRALVYSHASGFKHSSIPTGIKALRIMSEKTKAFEATFTVKTDQFTTDGLSKYDLLIFNNCTHVQKAFTEEVQRKAILDFIRNGKAFVGFHAASDGGMPQWQEYTEMIGGCFAGHPWNAGGTWPFFLVDDKHPVNRAFPEKEFKFSDEIYQYKGYDRSKIRVLVGLDSLQTDKKGNSKTNDYPVSWVRSYGKGKVFYSNFGHNKATWWTPFILQHFLDGIKWSLSELEGPSKSIPHKK